MSSFFNIRNISDHMAQGKQQLNFGRNRRLGTEKNLTRMDAQKDGRTDGWTADGWTD